MTGSGISMDLKDFISTTLISIKQGIAEANKVDKAYLIVPENKVVNFDIAVEVSKEGKSGGSGGVKIHVVEAKLGKDQTNRESNVSRINFTVGVSTGIS